MKHTPTPWKTQNPNTGNPEVDNHWLDVVETEKTGSICTAYTQDAKFIVKAVNCHDELVEALKATQNILLQNRALGLCQGSEYVYIVKKIQQALAKAEEK